MQMTTESRLLVLGQSMLMQCFIYLFRGMENDNIVVTEVASDVDGITIISPSVIFV